MPYKGINDKTLPEHVKGLTAKERRAFIEAFNAMHEDCMANKGEDCEGKAMMAGNKAMKDMQGMMENTTELHEPLWEMVTEFSGDYPDIQLNAETLAAIEDDQPSFFTLRIGRVGALSRNKTRSGKPRLYGETAMKSVLEQVNRGLDGNLGHIPAIKRDTHFNLPILRYLAAEIDSEGVLWAKAYVPKYASDVREYLRGSARLKRPVGTSIYGTAQINEDTGEVVQVNLETIDLVDAGRVGVTAAVGVPLVTSEMESMENDTMPDEITQEAQAAGAQVSELAELTAERDTLRSQLAEMTANLETVTSERDAALSRVSELESDNLDHTITSLVAELVELEPLRPAVAKHVALLRRVGDVTNAETARGAITAYLSDEDTKAIAQKLVSEMSGGNAIVSAGREPGKLNDTPEEREKALAAFGLS